MNASVSLRHYNWMSYSVNYKCVCEDGIAGTVVLVWLICRTCSDIRINIEKV